MVALSSISTRQPNERATHPVDPSRALSRPVSRRIRSSTRSASYDRILRSPEEQGAVRGGRTRSDRSNVSYDRIDRLPTTRFDQAGEDGYAQSLFSISRYNLSRVGMTVSFAG